VHLLVLHCCREWWTAGLEQPSEYHDFGEVAGKTMSKITNRNNASEMNLQDSSTSYLSRRWGCCVWAFIGIINTIVKSYWEELKCAYARFGN